jgi:uncharacterized protein YfcZ (UPF0381/DUF406 family)
MSVEVKMDEYTIYYLKGDKGPIDDRIFHSRAEAEQAFEELKAKVPSVVSENVDIVDQTIRRQMLTE